MQILDIQNASVFRGRNKVFDDLSVSVLAGAHTAIVGPNGAGKTTLLKILAREIYPSGGRVKIYGKERWNVQDLRKKLGIVSDEIQKNYAPHAVGSSVVLSGFYSSFDTFEHQSFCHEQLQAAKRVAQEIGIEHLSDKPYAQMSTGEQRRHLLARALVNDPETLVLDEPTAGLDLTGQFHYLETIRGLVNSGKTLILVTHHIHEIPPEISQVILIKKGAVVLHERKENALTDQNLTKLFDVPVKVVSHNGYYQVAPG